MSTFFAQPYNLDAVSFYFDTLEAYTEKSGSLLDAFGNPVEEFEIQFIDGDDCELFSACGINQANLNRWFETIADLAEHEKKALFYLCSVSGPPDCGIALYLSTRSTRGDRVMPSISKYSAPNAPRLIFTFGLVTIRTSRLSSTTFQI